MNDLNKWLRDLPDHIFEPTVAKELQCLRNLKQWRIK